MKVLVEQGGIQEATADTVVVNLFEGVSEPAGATGAVDRALGGVIAELIASGDMTGQLGEVTVLYPRGSVPATRVLVTGLGKPEALKAETARKASAYAAARARKLGAKRLATVVHGAGVGGLPLAEATQATVEGALLALYRFKKDTATKGMAKGSPGPDELVVVEFDSERLAQLESGARAAAAVAEGVTLARDLVNLPPNVATPEHMAQVTRELADAYGFALTVGDRSWAEELGMGAFLAVAKGAGEEPRFIVLEHGQGASGPPVVLVGKGITFDTGGISLKSSGGMPDMKSDMAGAAAVLGVMKAVGELGLGRRVVALAPCTENMPDARAYRPSDVLTAMNGKTIEVVSTDAEGRLILADALAYAARYEPRAVIDIATLTGSCVVALGQGTAAGLFANEDELQGELMRAGDQAHERLWPLPLWDDYLRAIKSDVADMKNSGGRSGGVGASAVFLKQFTSYPWAHIDIAGVAFTKKAGAYTTKGGSGFGVRLLVEYLRNLDQSS